VARKAHQRHANTARPARHTHSWGKDPSRTQERPPPPPPPPKSALGGPTVVEGHGKVVHLLLHQLLAKSSVSCLPAWRPLHLIAHGPFDMLVCRGKMDSATVQKAAPPQFMHLPGGAGRHHEAVWHLTGEVQTEELLHSLSLCASASARWIVRPAPLGLQMVTSFRLAGINSYNPMHE